jgi:hypothetical protein
VSRQTGGTLSDSALIFISAKNALFYSLKAYVPRVLGRLPSVRNLLILPKAAGRFEPFSILRNPFFRNLRVPGFGIRL